MGHDGTFEDDIGSLLRLLARAQELHQEDPLLSQALEVAARMGQTYGPLIEMDPLTKVRNRRSFDSTLRAEIARTRREHTTAQKESVDYGNPQQPPPGLSLVILDVDYFKHWNDELGHVVGDTILVELAQTILGQIREEDDQHLYRIGGDEFAILLPRTNLDSAITIGQRIANAVKREDPRVKQLVCSQAGSGVYDLEAMLTSATLQLSCSIGIAHYKDHEDPDPDKLTKKADRAMYDVKGRLGKGNVTIYETNEQGLLTERKFKHDLKVLHTSGKLFTVLFASPSQLSGFEDGDSYDRTKDRQIPYQVGEYHAFLLTGMDRQQSAREASALFHQGRYTAIGGVMGESSILAPEYQNRALEALRQAPEKGMVYIKQNNPV
ncbi:GGDEF domain-containing protein [Candidatus Woesearchaeota archaeon]|nr:GGDEF domain-containing protein [Candidatus Woesearchaeota archaeon]